VSTQRPWLALAIGLALAASAAAQERVTGEPTGNFRELLSEWSRMDGETRALEQQIRAAQSPQQAEPLRKTYDQLVATQFQLFARLQSAAELEYSRAPNEDADVARTLVGMLKDLVRRDHYDAAWRIGELLLKHHCADKAVPNFAGLAAYGRDDFANAEALLSSAAEQRTLSEDGQRCLADVEQAKRLWATEAALRDREAAEDNLPRVRLETTKGPIVLELYENEAPETVGNFVNLVEKGFYNGLTFHRVINNFVAQAGCPQGDGRGGPGYHIRCECYEKQHRNHFSGTLSMAHAGRNTGGSQFFLTLRRTPHLDGKHTVFGRVIEGRDVLASLQRREPPRLPGGAAVAPDRIIKAEVLRKRDHAYEPVRVN
jgi:cyclophilin family peptidyl-prolyl cis-trans isomerase